MDPLSARLVLTLALVGSAALWITFLNRSHGLGAWRPLIHACSGLALVGFLAGPLVVAVAVEQWSPGALGWASPWVEAGAERLHATFDPLPDVTTAGALPTTAGMYAWFCAALALVMPAWWLVERLPRQGRRRVVANLTTTLDLRSRARSAGWTRGMWRLAERLPGNDVYRLEVNERKLAIDRLPAALEGLSIAHLTDFHMSGRIDRAYFHEVVARTNALAPDLVAITGDLVDADACIDWIADTLGRLIAPLGVYFILGNHDCEVDVDALREALLRAGLQDLGGRTQRVGVGEQQVLLAGNELPWIRPAADVKPVSRAAGSQRDDAQRGDARRGLSQHGATAAADRQPAVGHDAVSARELRVLLAHCPDQFGWACRRDFDLVLAGHTHGGQVCFPLIGPLLVPSVFGTRYASGVFYRRPTVMHVSRGVSGLTPVRMLCRPEIALLRLTRPTFPRDRADKENATAPSFATWT